MNSYYSLPALAISKKLRFFTLVALFLAGGSLSANAATGSIADAEPYDAEVIYHTPGTRVSYTEEDEAGVLRGAIFTNAW